MVKKFHFTKPLLISLFVCLFVCLFGCSGCLFVCLLFLILRMERTRRSDQFNWKFVGCIKLGIFNFLFACHVLNKTWPLKVCLSLHASCYNKIMITLKVCLCWTKKLIEITDSLY